MPRVRIAIALLVPEPAATEIDGLRRALGDRSRGNVVPHITLIPPVNVRVEQLVDVLALLRAAASEAAPIELRLGPPATFAPVTPVVYLAVGGEVDAVHGLRAALHEGPLARPQEHEFVPHVTVQDDCPADRIAAALAALADFTVDVRVGDVHLLRDHAPGPRRWNAVADARFERPLVVGRGGREVEIVASSIADPEVLERFADERGMRSAGGEPLTVVARHEGTIVAAARGWVVDAEPELVEIVGDRELVRPLLKAAAQSSAARVRQPKSTDA